MSGNEFLIVFMVAAAVGGAWGARRSGAEGWRGAVVVIVSALITTAVFMALKVSNTLLSAIVNLALAGVVGGALKLTPRQITMTILGGLLLSFIVSFALSFFWLPS